MSELKSCPLCGADARLTSMDGVIANGHALRFVACTNEACQASVWKHSDGDAVTAWNRRAAPPIGQRYRNEAGEVVAVVVPIEPDISMTYAIEQTALPDFCTSSRQSRHHELGVKTYCAMLAALSEP